MPLVTMHVPSHLKFNSRKSSKNVVDLSNVTCAVKFATNQVSGRNCAYKLTLLSKLLWLLNGFKNYVYCHQWRTAGRESAVIGDLTAQSCERPGGELPVNCSNIVK
uniref:Uncharacterized protein n=1 Tax=Glossina palpalis gambiensis TaxID=67801 RepID=A0A1B0AS80_9MUSC